MRIAQSSVHLQAARSAVSYTRESTRIELREALPPPPSPEPEDRVELEEGHGLGLGKDVDLKSWIARLVLEAFTGRKLEDLVGPEETEEKQQDRPERGRRGGLEVELHHERVHYEAEAVQVRGAGRVTTADGRTIEFGLQLDMQREHFERTTLDIVAGDAGVKKDPLVLHLSGPPTRLDGPRTALDLDGDGSREVFSAPSAGSAFLAMDRDGNGTIDGGHELFGPRTGNGFAELARLDDDADGWIDEDDAAWGRLQLWDVAGGTLQSLREAGVGAIHTGSVRSEFALGDTAAGAAGFVAATGVFLREDGGAGAVQHIDLVV